MSLGQTLKDVGRVILLIVIGIPIAFLLSGPVLLVASVRGRLRAGPFLFDFRHYADWQRGVVVFLGIVIAALVWGGAGMALIQIAPPERWLASLARRPIDRFPTATPYLLTQPTEAPATSLSGSPTTRSGATLWLITPLPTHTPTPPPSLTPTQPSPTASPTIPVISPSPQPSSPVPTPQVQATATSVPITATLAPAHLAQVVPETVDRANQRLALAIADPSPANLERLAEGWRGEALEKTSNLAMELSLRSAPPLTVSYIYVITPSFVALTGDGHVEANARELWTYKSAKSTYTETVEYHYSLNKIEDTWYVVDYRSITWEHSP
jgi:hypothetical protein